jgi:hypothetical protein
MLLVIAEDSLGYYMVDRDGYVYTRHPFFVADKPYGPNPNYQLHIKPGERPDPRVHVQISYATGFWLATGQREELNEEQIAIFEAHFEAHQEQGDENMNDSICRLTKRAWLRHFVRNPFWTLRYMGRPS